MKTRISKPFSNTRTATEVQQDTLSALNHGGTPIIHLSDGQAYVWGCNTYQGSEGYKKTPHAIYLADIVQNQLDMAEKSLTGPTLEQLQAFADQIAANSAIY